MDIEELLTIPLFAGLPPEELTVIASACSRSWVLKDRHIAKEGDFAYKLCAILSGTATVSSGGRLVAELGPGDVFGEMALVADVRRNADVVAGDDLHLATMLSWDFRAAIEQCPMFQAAIDGLIASRS